MTQDLRAAAQAVLTALDILISESQGVYGLHLNGDPSPWDEITGGGRFEEWLAPLEVLRTALATPAPVKPSSTPPVRARRAAGIAAGARSPDDVKSGVVQCCR